MPLASCTQLSSGRARSNSSLDAGPGWAPTASNSPCKILYTRLANTTLTTLSRSRAWVHSDCKAYMPPPSDCKHTVLRSGQATAAPVAQGKPWPIAPPVICNQSLAAAPKVWPNKLRPEVTASSTTMALSGSKAAKVMAKASGLKAPRCTMGRGPVSGAPAQAGAPKASASHSSAATASWSGRANTCIWASGGDIRLGLPG